MDYEHDYAFFQNNSDASGHLPSYMASPNIDFACMGFRQTADPDDGVMRFHQPYAKYADTLVAEMPTDLMSMIDRTMLDYEGEI